MFSWAVSGNSARRLDLLIGKGSSLCLLSPNCRRLRYSWCGLCAARLAALLAIGSAYAAFGTANPARYRLMFGTALGPSRSGLPALVGEAAARSKAVLSHVLEDGVRQKRFAAPGDDVADPAFLTLAAWSVMHGLTMLLIDGLSEIEPTSDLFDRIGLALLRGIETR